MTKTQAQRQKEYRYRQKRQQFYLTNYSYQRLLKLTANIANKQDILGLINDSYNLAGPELARRICILLNEHFSLAQIVQADADQRLLVHQQWSS